MYKKLSDFITLLESKGELIRIKEEVSTELEIAEITDRECKKENGGKALLFENCGYDFPVLTNMFGSDRRMAAALGVDCLSELPERIETLFASLVTPKEGLGDKLKMLPLLSSFAKWMPKKRRGRGDCQRHVYMPTVDEPLLDRLPVLKCAPLDAGRFITLPMVNTQDPVTGVRNVGMYRMQIFSNDTTGMHWHCHKTGERHYRAYQKAGKRMPLTVTLGGDPAYTYAATAPLPDNVDEYMLAGFLRGRSVELVKSLTNDIYIPADCDFVIEGYVDPLEDKVVEGPFGDHTGFYSLEDRYPLFHVTCITHRRDAVYPATIVGVPPQEDAYIAKATENIFLAPIRCVLQPDLKDMFLPQEGVAHNIALVDIDKTYPGQAFKVASSLWGAGQMMFNKFILLTNGLQGRLRDSESIRLALENVSPKEDVLFSKGPLDVLDHTAPAMGLGGKMAVDATFKEPCERVSETEGFLRNCHIETLTGELTNFSDLLWHKGWSTLLLKGTSRGEFRSEIESFLTTNTQVTPKFLFLFDAQVRLDDLSLVVWLMGSNVDPLRDVFLYADRTLCFDVRAKYNGLSGFARRWPNVVAMSPDVIRRVDEKWNALGIGPFTPSPSLDMLPLVLSEEADV